MTDKMQQSFADGKYTVIYEGGKVTALRYGEPWQDLTGNNLVYWMLVEVDKLRGNPPAPTAQPAANDRLRMALRADLATESLAVDDLLRAMGEDPETYRTDGGAINRPRLLAWLKNRDAHPAAAPDGRLHADGYFTWKRRDGYVLDAKLPCDFYLAAPAQRQPLSEAQIAGTATETTGWLNPPPSLFSLARAIEAAHGITAAPAAQKGEKL